MDPNEALKVCRENFQVLNIQSIDSGDAYLAFDALLNIAENFHNLDKWLSDGGFLPTAWNRHRRATL